MLEADQLEQINRAVGEAEALLAVAKARAKGLNTVAEALKKPVRYQPEWF